MILILIRHGQPQGEREFRFHGQSGVPLGYRGKRQARLAAERLGRERPDLIVSSDLKRALETAQICASLVDMPVIPREEFREADVGTWTGLMWKEVEQAFPKDLAVWQDNRIYHRRGGGESFVDMEQRVVSGLQSILEHHSQSKVTIVCHTGTIRAILSGLGISNRKGVLSLSVAHCSFTTLLTEAAEAKMLSFNETEHLRTDERFINRVRRAGI